MGLSAPRFIRRLVCRHRDVHFVRNVYGDEINHLGGKRSVWRCQACAAIVYRADLHTMLTARPPTPPAPPRGAMIQPDRPWPRHATSSDDDTSLSLHGLSSWRPEPTSAPEPDRFTSGGGGDFGGGGASYSWGDSSSGSSCSSDSGSSSSDSGSSSCSSD